MADTKLPASIQKLSARLSSIERELNALTALGVERAEKRKAGLIDMPGDLSIGERRRWDALCDQRAEAYWALDDALMALVDRRIEQRKQKTFRPGDIERSFDAWMAADDRLEKSMAQPISTLDNVRLLVAIHAENLRWKIYQLAKANKEFWSSRPKSVSRKPVTDGRVRTGYKMIDGVRVPVVEEV